MPLKLKRQRDTEKIILLHARDTQHKSNQNQACEQGKFLKTEHGHSTFKMLHICMACTNINICYLVNSSVRAKVVII
jgi:hypothetical protein